MSQAACRVLCVDDEPRLLAGLERTLSSYCEVQTAESATTALRMLQAPSHFDVVISDMRMPGMDGAAFLTEVRKQHPDTVRILLTGEADMPSAANAVNQGAIFRFLTKPCDPRTLQASIDAAVEHRRVAALERDLLARTLAGAVGILTDIMSLAAPNAFRRSAFIRRCVAHAASKLGWAEPWRFEMAARLSQIGCVATSGERHGDDGHHHASSESNAEVAWRLLKRIPRLETIADMVRYQASVPPADAAPEVARGAALLRAALALERAATNGDLRGKTRKVLGVAIPAFDPALIDALADFDVNVRSSGSVRVSELRIGDVLETDVCTSTGALLLPHGHEVNAVSLERLARFAATVGVREPVQVRIVA